MIKRIFLSILAVLLVTTAYTQNRAECERIVSVVFDAVGQQNIDKIKIYLSENIKIAGQSSSIAEKVLEQLVNNLGNIKSFKLTEANTDTGLTLNYDVEYERHGNRHALFEFDENNKIKRLELLKVEIKTANIDQSKISYNPSNVIEIPFTKMENLIIVKASVDGVERNFILDSGSGFTILNSKYTEKDTTDTEANQTVLSTAKGVHNESLSGTNLIRTSVNFYGIRVDGQDMLTLDISHLELDGRHIYGLIGYDFLSKYDVLYDYSKNVVVLIKPDYFETYRKEKLAGHRIETVPLEWRGHIPIICIRIGDRNYNMGIDCGAAANLLDTSFFTEVKGFLKKISSQSLSGASKGKQEVTDALLKKFKIGTTAYKNTHLVFSNIAHLNQEKEVNIEGLLGYEFLSKFPTLLSYERKELLLIK